MSAHPLRARGLTYDSTATEIEELRDQIREMKTRFDQQKRENRISLVCFSGDWDRLFAAFVIANGALAMGQEVEIFLTFWAAAALRKGAAPLKAKTLFERLMGTMLPAGADRAPLSRMDYFGLGRLMLRRRMKSKGIEGLGELIERAQEMGARVHLCEMSSEILGFRCDEMVGKREIDPCGVATFLGTALRGKAVIFI